MNEQTIRELAYEKWQEAGSPSGDGVKFWLEAEAEIQSQNQNKGSKAKSKSCQVSERAAAKKSTR